MKKKKKRERRKEIFPTVPPAYHQSLFKLLASHTRRFTKKIVKLYPYFLTSLKMAFKSKLEVYKNTIQYHKYWVVFFMILYKSMYIGIQQSKNINSDCNIKF